MERLEFDLSQGWTRGLKIVFGDRETSKSLNPKVALHVNQVHGNEILSVGPDDLSKQSPLETADGLWLQGDWFQKSKRPLMIKTADCVPLFYIDRIQKSIAAVHAGWRGIQKGIHLRPFEIGDFDPKTTWVWCGPSLNDFEVRSDMWKMFPPDRLRPPFFKETADPEVKIFSPWAYLAEDFQKKIGVDIFYNTEVNTQDDQNFASYRREVSAGRLKPGEKMSQQNLSWIGFNQ
jgi:polyphenol oxidase